MILSIELTDTEYVAVQHALRHVSRSRAIIRLCVLSEAQQLELEHLRTLLAEAAAPKEEQQETGCQDTDCAGDSNCRCWDDS